MVPKIRIERTRSALRVRRSTRLSYLGVNDGARSVDRTRDLTLTKGVRYRLRHAGKLVNGTGLEPVNDPA